MRRFYTTMLCLGLFGCSPTAGHDECGSFNYVLISQGDHRLDVSSLGTSVSDTAPSLEATLKRADAEGEAATVFLLEGDSSDGFALVTDTVIAPEGACLDAYDFSVTYALSVPPDWSVDAAATFPDMILESTVTQSEEMADHVLWNDWDLVVDANLQAPKH